MLFLLTLILFVMTGKITPYDRGDMFLFFTIIAVVELGLEICLGITVVQIKF